MTNIGRMSAFMEIGRGYAATETFCGLMNMPPQRNMSTYQVISFTLHSVRLNERERFDTCYAIAFKVLVKLKLITKIMKHLFIFFKKLPVHGLDIHVDFVFICVTLKYASSRKTVFSQRFAKKGLFRRISEEPSNIVV